MARQLTGDDRLLLDLIEGDPTLLDLFRCEPEHPNAVVRCSKCGEWAPAAELVSGAHLDCAGRG